MPQQGNVKAMHKFGRALMARRSVVAPLTLIVLMIVLAVAALAQTADEVKTYTKKASFEDVKFDLANAITNRGLVVDFAGNVGGMLARTGKDVGSDKPIYKNAEYMSFCSAKLSRDMMESEPGNVVHCPFVIFAYETVAKPGEVVVGYRPLPKGGNVASVKVFDAITDLLDGIAKEAVK